jgi:hypothetical protein
MRQFIDKLKEFNNDSSTLLNRNYSIRSREIEDSIQDPYDRANFQAIDELERETLSKNIKNNLRSLQETAITRFGFTFQTENLYIPRISHIRIESLQDFKFFYSDLSRMDESFIFSSIHDLYRHGIFCNLDTRGQNMDRETFLHILGANPLEEQDIDIVIDLSEINHMIQSVQAANAFRFIKELTYQTLSDYAQGAMSTIYQSLVVLEEVRLPIKMRYEFSDFKDKYNQWVISLEKNDKYTLQFGVSHGEIDYESLQNI